MNLKITTIQTDLHWENVAKNLEMFAAKITAITEETDVIVLPEMFNTGFSMDSEKLAETMDGVTVTWMKEQSEKANAVIVGSLIVRVDSFEAFTSVKHAQGATLFYNRLVWVQPDGVISTYDKRHLFRMANEQEHFTAGTQRLIINYKGWRICPLVCYDLRFPVWARNKQLSVDSCQLSGSQEQKTNNSQRNSNVYDILIYIANWPAVRKAPWSKLLEARAIENQCYVVGVNRVGVDGTGKDYSGNSVIINPKGNPITTIPENEKSCVTSNLSMNELTDFRKAFPVGLDGDEFDFPISK